MWQCLENSCGLWFSTKFNPCLSTESGRERKKINSVLICQALQVYFHLILTKPQEIIQPLFRLNCLPSTSPRLPPPPPGFWSLEPAWCLISKRAQGLTAGLPHRPFGCTQIFPPGRAGPWTTPEHPCNHSPWCPLTHLVGPVLLARWGPGVILWVALP